MIKTDLCELLDLKYPIFQGGMAWIADASLAAAVSNAGGLGIIAAMNADAKWLREEIHKARQLTERPFGVNVMLMSPFADEVAQVVVEEKVPVVVTGAGNPGKYMKQWVQAGIKVIPVVASVAMAKLMTRLGASALIAEGGESGGHVGELTTMVLVPQVCDATSLPVIAAGGIADGRGAAAAFVLGSLLGGYYISAKGLRKVLFTLCCCFNIPFLVYTFLACFQPDNGLIIASAIVFEYFGYGFGFVGLMLFMMQQVAPGKHQMAHYAFASGIMNLGVMLPGMMSGFVSDWLGYKYFFIVTLLAMIPSFLVAYFVPFTYDDKGNKLVQ